MYISEWLFAQKGVLIHVSAVNVWKNASSCATYMSNKGLEKHCSE